MGTDEFFKKEIPRIQKEGVFLLLPRFFNPGCSSGQTAKTKRRSSHRAGINLSIDIVGVKDGEGGRGGLSRNKGRMKEDNKHQ